MRTRKMIVRPIGRVALLSAVLAAAGPAWAETGAPEIIYEEEAVIQPLPGSAPVSIEREAEPEFEELERRAEYRREHAHAPMHHAVGHPPLEYRGEPLGVPIYFPYPGHAGRLPGETSDCREERDGCEAYLPEHAAQWRHMGCCYGPVMLVPIMIPVEQRAVVREYVTEEWIEEEVIVGKSVTGTAAAPKRGKVLPVKTRRDRSTHGR